VGRVHFSPAAVADLGAIWDYTLERWGAGQAEFYVREINECCQRLANGTLPGVDASDIRDGYSKQFVGRHVIYFRRTANDAINVIRILHQAMDASTRLQGP
tara:strand:- start:2329 stop:2631 length:303 start_codon:yes stop_codon:yes gene_type:complete